MCIGRWSIHRYDLYVCFVWLWYEIWVLLFLNIIVGDYVMILICFPFQFFFFWSIGLCLYSIVGYENTSSKKINKTNLPSSLSSSHCIMNLISCFLLYLLYKDIVLLLLCPTRPNSTDYLQFAILTLTNTDKYWLILKYMHFCVTQSICSWLAVPKKKIQ